MPFYPNQRCQRCSQQSSCSVQRPVPEPQHLESNHPCKHNLPPERRNSALADPNRSERTTLADQNFSDNHSVSDCPCHRAAASEHRRTMPEDPAIAMAYVPWQRWANLANRTQALQQGTIFVDLNKPFSGKGGTCR